MHRYLVCFGLQVGVLDDFPVLDQKAVGVGVGAAVQVAHHALADEPTEGGAAGADELLAGVAGEAVRVAVQLQADAVDLDLLGDVGGDQAVVVARFAQVVVLLFGAFIGQVQGPGDGGLDGLFIRGQAEEVLVEGADVVAQLDRQVGLFVRGDGLQQLAVVEQVAPLLGLVDDPGVGVDHVTGGGQVGQDQRDAERADVAEGGVDVFELAEHGRLFLVLVSGQFVLEVVAVGRFDHTIELPFGVAEAVDKHACAIAGTGHAGHRALADPAAAAGHDRIDLGQNGIAAPGMDDVVGYGRNREITQNADDHKDHVGGIVTGEQGIAGLLDLSDVQLEHVLLDLAQNGAKDVGNGQPQKDVDVAGDPDRQGVLQAVKDGEAQHQRAQDGQDDQKKGTQGVDAQGGGLVDDLQYLADELLEALAHLIILLVGPEADVVADTFQPALGTGLGVLGIGELVPGGAVAAAVGAHVGFPFVGLFQLELFLFEQGLDGGVRVLDHALGAGDAEREHAVHHPQHRGKGHNDQAQGKGSQQRVDIDGLSLGDLPPHAGGDVPQGGEAGNGPPGVDQVRAERNHVGIHLVQDRLQAADLLGNALGGAAQG